MPSFPRPFRAALLLPLLVGISASVGCTHRIGDFSLLSTSTPSYPNMDDAPIRRKVKGSDYRLTTLIFIPLGGAPSIEEAVDRALDAGDGDFLERVRIYEVRWNLILIGYEGFRVIADVGNSRPQRPKTEGAQR